MAKERVPFHLQTPDIIQYPGGHITEQAQAIGADPIASMLDTPFFRKYSARGGEMVTAGGIVDAGFTLRDFWNDPNFLFKNPDLASRLSLPPEATLDAGLIGSKLLPDYIAPLLAEEFQITSDLPHERLTQLANVAVAQLAREHLPAVQLLHSHTDDPSERQRRIVYPLLYSTLIVLGKKATKLTFVGDVSAWVDGEQIGGYDKIYDVLKNDLINDLYAFDEFTLTDEDLMQRNEHFTNRALEFAQRCGYSVSDTEELIGRLIMASNKAHWASENLVRQTIYEVVDNVGSRKQILDYQNQDRKVVEMAYPALDGVGTNDELTDTVTIPTDDINTLVLASDGTKPIDGENMRVTSKDHLVLRNETWSEGTVVVWSRDSHINGNEL